MGKILCLLGAHSWHQRHNPEASGAGGDFQACKRCGKEKSGYGKPPSTGVVRG